VKENERLKQEMDDRRENDRIQKEQRDLARRYHRETGRGELIDEDPQLDQGQPPQSSTMDSAGLSAVAEERTQDVSGMMMTGAHSASRTRRTTNSQHQPTTIPERGQRGRAPPLAATDNYDNDAFDDDQPSRGGTRRQQQATSGKNRRAPPPVDDDYDDNEVAPRNKGTVRRQANNREYDNDDDEGVAGLVKRTATSGKTGAAAAGRRAPPQHQRSDDDEDIEAQPVRAATATRDKAPNELSEESEEDSVLPVPRKRAAVKQQPVDDSSPPRAAAKTKANGRGGGNTKTTNKSGGGKGGKPAANSSSAAAKREAKAMVVAAQGAAQAHAAASVIADQQFKALQAEKEKLRLALKKEKAKWENEVKKQERKKRVASIEDEKLEQRKARLRRVQSFPKGAPPPDHDHEPNKHPPIAGRRGPPSKKGSVPTTNPNGGRGGGSGAPSHDRSSVHSAPRRLTYVMHFVPPSVCYLSSFMLSLSFIIVVM
jgi:hypothetical protein